MRRSNCQELEHRLRISPLQFLIPIPFDHRRSALISSTLLYKMDKDGRVFLQQLSPYLGINRPRMNTMSPTIWITRDPTANTSSSNPRPQDPDAVIYESWTQGYLVGSIIIMACITISNMRKGVLLHK